MTSHMHLDLENWMLTLIKTERVSAFYRGKDGGTCR
jgi:hypothetical protein